MPTPVRGTQSFVAVMSRIWSRPSLSALEIAWRWPIGAIILIPLCFKTGTTWLDHPEQLRIWATLTLHHAFIYAVHWRVLIPTVLAVFLLWNLAATFGRTLVLRRLDSTLHARRLTVFLLSTLRALCLFAAWTFWLRGLLWATHVAPPDPANGDGSSIVLFAALLIPGTLVIYVAWAAASWPLQLAPLLAMRCNLGPLAALRSAFASPKDLRGKLLEINLVLCIVRIALLVLAMVFSASPLAFQSVTTPQFFAVWWAAAALLYLAASDYFHVVRSAAYLALHHALSS